MKKQTKTPTKNENKREGGSGQGKRPTAPPADSLPRELPYWRKSKT